MLLTEAINPKEIRLSLGLLTEKAWKELLFQKKKTSQILLSVTSTTKYPVRVHINALTNPSLCLKVNSSKFVDAKLSIIILRVSSMLR